MMTLIKELNTESAELAEYKSLPFWSWNDKLDTKELQKQIHWMKEKGIGGFFMHARGGLKTPYLSEEWMQCIDACIETANKEGMEAWVYDENGWPSGFVGGKLLENEANRNTYLTYSIGSYDDSAWLNYSLEKEQLCRLADYAEGQCLNLFMHISPSTVDILNGDVVEQFLEETHEKYAERYGELFSQYLAGFFTDEPQYYREKTAYTRIMPEVFKERYGEELLDNLGLLFVEKEGYRSFRYRYWTTMQQLMLTNFAERVYNWCDNHGVKLTGHYIEETTLGFQMCCCAGVMSFYEYMHMPGIDWLGRGVGNHLSLRQVASAAQQLGKKQVLAETYGCCGWDVTPEELKRIGDFLYIGGVNRTCQHLIPYSEHGQRKKDHPVHFSWINPWVDLHFKDFNDYFTRLGYLLGESKEFVKVAMLHPMRSAYLGYKEDGAQGSISVGELEKAFRRQREQFSQAQIPYHFLDETLMERHGFVNGTSIGCGLCEYEYLVIPTCYTMGRRTEELIRKFVENGGKVLLLDDKPSYLEGEAYDYSYLESNVTFEELSEHLPYCLRDRVEGVHSTLRQSQDEFILCVQNYTENIKTITYELKGEYETFEQWNLMSMTSSIVPTTVTLQPNATCVLVFSKEQLPETEVKNIVQLQPRAEVLSVTENFLTIDAIQYSKDGVNYSESMPCIGVFQLLLEERYEGPLYIKYAFRAKKVPSQISVIVEKCEHSEVFVNGHKLELTEQWERDFQFVRGDITDYVQVGDNEVVQTMHFYQSETVYYALFGDGVTEGLRNCLSYDAEIEPIYLAGNFGVYAEVLKEGNEEGILLGEQFYLAESETEVENLVRDGYPFFSGIMRLRRSVMLERKETVLEFRGRFQAMTVWVNGNKAGDLVFGHYLNISEFAKVGMNDIEIELIVGNRNLFGPHHMKAAEEPKEVSPYAFDVKDWKNGKSYEYREAYSFVSVAIC